VTVQLEQEDGSPLRLETAGGGRVVGEVGFYLDRPRTADVIADEDTGAYALKRETLERIKIEDPNVLYTLSRLVVNQTSERIVAMTRALDALED
jgi:SulP family sulfate permease